MQTVRDLPREPVAVAAANSAPVIAGAVQARDDNVAEPVLYGDPDKIASLASELGLDLTGVEVVNEPDDLAAAAQAVEACASGECHMLMKGHLHTDDFLRAVLKKEGGLRVPGVLMSHVFILEATAAGRLLFVTDGAMNIAPDLEQKAQILQNAVYLARCFGIEEPKVGVVAAVEVVNPKMPVTIEAAAFAGMDRRGQVPHCVVDGPFGLDNAVSSEAARIKGLGGPVAGECDILLMPDIEAGNIMAKTFAFLGGGRVAGVLVGASVPIVLTSRADTAQARLFSMATAALMSRLSRDAGLKIGKVHY
ncbi:MAG: bifunctional enoyl-CoA hydratase/phosphate acetyltransferase [Armatimonadetes bacterium]|nr:bifunctional enoyl-CoA hydratase/phosphate acetyltransferase [Armatimonadota bacterium]